MTATKMLPAVTADESAPPTVLVLRALGLGDLCTGIPALRALRRRFADHRVLLAAPAWQAPLVATVGVDAVLPVNGLGGSLLSKRPTIAVNLHGVGPQSTQQLSKLDPGRLIAYRRPDDVEMAGASVWDDDEHDVVRWCRLLCEHGIDADPSDRHLPPPAPELSPVPPGTILLHPGAAAKGRRWPPERFAQVARWLCDRGEQVALTGSREEAALCAAVARRSQRHVIELAGRTDLLHLCAAVSVAAAVVSNDTGVAHVASAYRTPSVVLFGPVSPAHWGPPPWGPHRSLWRGRHGDPHADGLDAGLAAIETGEVLEAIDEVLDIDG